MGEDLQTSSIRKEHFKLAFIVVGGIGHLFKLLKLKFTFTNKKKSLLAMPI